MTVRKTGRPRHWTSLPTAIRNSTGDVIIPMDGDGQNDPADIPRLLAKLAAGFDLVSGWRTGREDDALHRGHLRVGKSDRHIVDVENQCGFYIAAGLRL